MLKLRLAALVFATIVPVIAAPAAGASALPNSEEAPIVGGSAALARSLGIDPLPERPRFLTELVRVIYDAPEGRNRDTDAKLLRLAKHVEVVNRFQATLAVVQPKDAGIALAMASAKGDRDRLKEFLDLVGLKLREKNKTYTVERSDNKQAAERVKVLSDLGIDLAGLAAQLNSGKPVRIDVPNESVLVPLTAKTWSDAVFGREVRLSSLFEAILADRRAALLAHGLAALDDETLKYLADHPPIITRIYEHDAAAFAAFGEALRIRDGRVVPPGGIRAVALWESLLDEKVTRPDRFVRELYSRDEARVACLYQTVAQLDVPHASFALGLWMTDASRRQDNLKSLMNVMAVFKEWVIIDRPFSPPVWDISLLLAQVRVRLDGTPAPPAARLLWERVLEGADLPNDPAKSLRNLQDEGPIDAGWLAERICVEDRRRRGERMAQLAFGQRVFAAAEPADLPNVLLALRAFPHYRTLALTLERVGVRHAVVFANAMRQADRLTALDGRRRFVALSQFQSSLALLARLVRVQSLAAPAAEQLAGTLAAVPLNEEGLYAGGIARWIEQGLTPALKIASDADVDAALVRALAGGVAAADAEKVEWEGRVYRLDLVTAEYQRITRIREKVGSPSIGAALHLEQVATAMGQPNVSLTDVQAAAAQLRTVLRALPPPDKKAESQLPAGVDAPKNARDVLNDAIQELSRIRAQKDLKKAAHAAVQLRELNDHLLGEALKSLAYAIDMGSADGTALMAGDVSRRHDFGFGIVDAEQRVRMAWAEPREVVEAGVPWHVKGSVLALDAGLATLVLRRVDTTTLPAKPVLTSSDRLAFTKTVAFMNPFDMTDAQRDAIVAAIERGRARVTALTQDAGQWDALADELAMDGFRRRAARWTIANDPAAVLSLFSLLELLNLGHPPAGVRLDAWGMAADESDSCLCMTMPRRGGAAIVSNRPQAGLMATTVADVNLRVALLLAEFHLPSALARGVLASAVQDYIDRVKPLHSGDWITFVRTAQAITKEQFEDYVAGLVADGPLVLDRAAGAPRPLP